MIRDKLRKERIGRGKELDILENLVRKL